MRVRVEYTCDWTANDNMDSGGRIIITGGDTHSLLATWECRGGKGQGAEIRESKGWTMDEAHAIANSTDICQGIGTFDGDLSHDDFGWPTLTNVVWPDDPTDPI